MNRVLTGYPNITLNLAVLYHEVLLSVSLCRRQSFCEDVRVARAIAVLLRYGMCEIQNAKLTEVLTECLVFHY